VVAQADRGNYPLVSFEGCDGDTYEWYPSMIALRDDELCAGHQALSLVDDPSWTVLRSIKRSLAQAGPLDQIAGRPVRELLTAFALQLKQALFEQSNLDLAPDQPLDVAIAVPANASASQRMLTADAFSGAGFTVRRIIDEPSAAGLEYAWRRPRDAAVQRRHVAVYDLGGGTFDASIISMSDRLHEVLTTEGIGRLGGDDFDEVLLQVVLDQLGRAQPDPGRKREHMLDACREEKERLTPNTRYLQPAFAEQDPFRVPAATFEAALEPLIERTICALSSAIERMGHIHGSSIEKHTVVYQVGGASQLPAVGRMLRKRFGRRVWRSPYPHGSVAIGLAIAAQEQTDVQIVERLTRHFGVWREYEAGGGVYYEPVFVKDTRLPTNGQRLSEVRRYQVHHNIGHYRFVECSNVSDGAPRGDVHPWREVLFPLQPELVGTDLTGLAVQRLAHPGDEIEERYNCDANGIVGIEIVNRTAGYQVLVDATKASAPVPA
jgi:molecular chaperone DnaK (HSP70)